MKTAADLVAEAKQRIREVTPDEVRAMRARGEDHVLLDVREPDEVAMGRVPGAMAIARGVLESAVEARVPRERPWWCTAPAATARRSRPTRCARWGTRRWRRCAAASRVVRRRGRDRRVSRPAGQAAGDPCRDAPGEPLGAALARPPWRRSRRRSPAGRGRWPWWARRPAAAAGGGRARPARAGRGGGAGAAARQARRVPGDPWSGHVAFPGGRAEPGDASPWHTAARETWEETGLDLLAAGRLLGTLDELYPRTPVLPPVVVRPHVAVVGGRAGRWC
jgi:hypothetical protein